jgi:Fic family protein
MTYEEILDYIDDNYNCNDIGNLSLNEFAKVISYDFYNVSLDVAKELARNIWDECQEEKEKERIDEPPPKEPKEVKLTENQKNDIKNVVQNEDLTKREQAIQTLEIVNKPFTITQFYQETGMVKSTARRELGQAVKRGELKRISRGVYQRI